MALIAGGSGNDSLTGTADGDVVNGHSGNDTLSDGGFADTLIGGSGNDVFIVGNTGTVVQDPGPGDNTIDSSVTYTLVSNVNTLSLTGGASITGTANSAADFLSANSGGDVLVDGGLGGSADTLIGGAGNDTFMVNHVGDEVLESPNSGTDLVVSTINYTLTANVEGLTLAAAGIAGTGNAKNSVISDDGLGNGADTMIGNSGGTGDTFLVNNAGDTVTENDATSTAALIVSSVNFTIAANVENLTLIGTNALAVTGNALDNIITDNTTAAGGDTLTGGGAVNGDTYIVSGLLDVINGNVGKADLIESSVDFLLASANVNNVNNLTLIGGAISATGNNNADVLTGNANNDVISDGIGAAADTMIGNSGGTGDTFIVNNINDSVTETFATATAALIKASVDVTLSANVNNLTFTGGAALAGIGNAGNNIFTDNGAAGGDTFTGNGGVDTYVVSSGNDVISANVGGTDLVNSSVSYSLAANAVDAANLTLTGGAAIAGTGNAGNNVITDNGAVDTLTGGGGVDTYVVSNSSDVINTNVGGTDFVETSVNFSLLTNAVDATRLTLTGASALVVSGNTFDNLITDNGAVAGDTMTGGGGSDTYVVSSSNDVINANVGGTDLVQSSVSYNLGTKAPNAAYLTLTGTAALTGVGNAGNNVITSNGAAAGDTLSGGGGVDTYIVNSVNDVVNANPGGGDTVETNVTYSLANVTNIQNLILTGAGNITGTGNGANNIITGNAGDNLLDGGAGADTMIGGAGNDTYMVDNTGDVVSENPGQGTDLVISSVSYALSANVENLTLTGATARIGTGNALNNIITDNGAVAGDTLIGGGGTDTYIISSANDHITGNGGGDLIISSVSYSLAASIVTGVNNLTLTGTAALTGTGNAADNVIIGNDGGDVINGGAGADTMTGGTGNDTFYVDNILDAVTSGGGSDEIFSSVSYTAPVGVTSLTLTGSANIAATGNAGSDILTANTGHDTLTGNGANDVFFITSNDTVHENFVGGNAIVVVTLVGGATGYAQPTNIAHVEIAGGSTSTVINGGAGDDILLGNSRNNILNGGAGADTMIGGLGNDTYKVDNVNDVCVENPGEGTDSIITSASYDMSTNAANVENLTATGKIGLLLAGNDWDNKIIGTSGNDTIVGNGGTDTLMGGAGNDTYYISNFIEDSQVATVADMIAFQGDVIKDSGGIDTVAANGNFSGTAPTAVTYTLLPGLENLDFSGFDPTVSCTLTGNSENNKIIGNAAADIINEGGKGADTMEGGGGADTYYVDNAKDLIIDTIHEDPTTPDIVNVSVSYVMSPTADVDNVILTGTRALTFTASNTGENITGNGAADVLIGGLGADTFTFTTASIAHVETIKNFNIPQGDVLDISGILTGYADGDIVSHFVHIIDSGLNSKVYVNAAGDGNAAHFVDIATIYHVNGLTGELALILDAQHTLVPIPPS